MVDRLVESAHCLLVVLEVPESRRELLVVLVACLVGGEFVSYGPRVTLRVGMRIRVLRVWMALA